jgi:hypothetical protein
MAKIQVFPSLINRKVALVQNRGKRWDLAAEISKCCSRAEFVGREHAT